MNKRTIKAIALLFAAVLLIVYVVTSLRARAREAEEREKKCLTGVDAARRALDARQWDLAKAMIADLAISCADAHQADIATFQKRLLEDPIFADLTTPIDGIWSIYEQLPKTRASLKQSYQASLARLPSPPSPMTARVADYIQSEYRKRALAFGLTGDPIADGMTQ